MAFSGYYGKENIKALLAEDQGYKRAVGGLWEEMGRLQLDFLISQGMKPCHTLLDIGCGTLRLGNLAARYLDPCNYWGTDLNDEFLDEGFKNEIIPQNLSGKLPRSHLISDIDFQFDGLPSKFDFIIAQSVFTHLPFNHLRLCLYNLCSHLESSASFFFTIFFPTGESKYEKALQLSGIETYPHADPYHYDLEDIDFAAKGLPVTITYIGDWKHPRNQMMIKAEIEC